MSLRNEGRSGETLASSSSGKLVGVFWKNSFEKSTICLESNLNASMLDSDPGRFRQREKFPRDGDDGDDGDDDDDDANAPARR